MVGASRQLILSFAALLLLSGVPMPPVRANLAMAETPGSPSDPTRPHSLIQRPHKQKPAPASGSRSTGAKQSSVPTQLPAPSTLAVPKAPVSVPDQHGRGDTASGISGEVAPKAPTSPGTSAGTSPWLRIQPAASITHPSVPLSSAELGGAGGLPAVPSSAANAVNKGGGATTSRGFTNLLSKFPQLGPTMNLGPGGSVPVTPVATGPVPVVVAPPPVVPPPAGVVMGSARLTWTPNQEPDLAGYRIYVGTRSGVYDYPGSPFTVGNITSTTISNLPHGQTYHFAATAYDFTGNESAFSSEVTKSLY